MKRMISAISALSLTLGLLAGCSGTSASSSSGTASGSTASTASSASATATADRELNLFTWENMFPQEVLDAFTQETGIRVKFTAFDTDETMLAKLAAAKGGDYDVVIADDYIIEAAISEGLVQELDKEKLTNLSNVNPLFQGQFFDPENAYTVPYGSGVQTIVYDPTLTDVEITSYADLWDAGLADSLAVIGNYRVVNGMALKVMGESYNTTDTATIAKAGEKLLELAPNIRLIKDSNVQDDLLSGEVSAAVMYTSQVTLACMANPDLKVVYPTEGLGFGIMAQFIPSAAPHPDEAHEFINYILRPEVAKQCFEYIGYYSTNKEADALISEEYRPFLTLPEDFTADKMEMIQNITPEADEEHVRVWTEFKAACE